MAYPRKVLYLAVFLGLTVLSGNLAYSQTPDQPKLTIGSISLGSTGDGSYNANVNLALQRTGNPQVSFNLSFQHVRTLDEVYAKLRPAVDHLADELKNAHDDFPH
ncbi:MAG: hypothetical protein ACLQDA_01840 [Terracidiphilus sp.]|jgi:hypothetical protein